MTHSRLLTLALVVTVGVLPRAAHAQSREQRQMMADLRMLQEQTQELAVALASLNQALQESVRAVNSRLADTDTATRRALADQKVSIDELGKDTRAVRERVDDTNIRVSNIREELEALRTAVATPPPPAPAPGPDGVDQAAAPGAPTAPSSPAPAAAPSTAGLSPTRMFDTARADYAAGQWSLALTGFDAFLKTFPRSEMADDAQFFIGETYFAQNRWMEAITAYNQVIQTYSGGNAVPDAYYKRGLALERMGQLDGARESWTTAVTNFPDSDAGRLAKQNLDRVARRATP